MTEVPLEEQIAMNVMDAQSTGRLIKGGQSVVIEHFSKSLLRDFLFNLSQVPSIGCDTCCVFKSYQIFLELA